MQNHHHLDDDHDHSRGSGRRGGRRRAGRGDVRSAVLRLLAEEPMHGYQLMQAISERTGGRWAPSPGAIYPTIAQLEDEGLVTVTAAAGRRLVALTERGRAEVEARTESDADPFAEVAGARRGRDLRLLLQQLHAAEREVARSGNDTQVESAATILQNARRALYRLLADEDDTTDSTGPAADAPA